MSQARVTRDGGTISPVFPGEYHRERAAGRGIAVAGGQVRADRARLERLAGLAGAGTLRVVLDGEYPLEEAAAAHTRAERGHLQGKIVLVVTD